MNKKSIFQTLLAASILAFSSCVSDDDGTTSQIVEIDGPNNFVLGLGVTTSTETTNFLLGIDDLMSGTINLQNQGYLQQGYRDYAFGGNTFYGIGGLGVTDLNTVTARDGGLNIKSGLTFPLQIDGFNALNRTTMLGISQPQDQTANAAIQFYTVDIAGNNIETTGTIPFAGVNPMPETSRIFHTGMQVSGGKLYHTFYLINKDNFNTPNTDTQYVAIYNYPALTLDQVISDSRFGPAGGFNTRSGVFVVDNDDLYTVSHSNFGYSQATKPAGILRIPAGTTAFDPEYTFNTETAPNGGKIIHAIYVGNNRLFAAISSKTLIPPAADGSDFGNVYNDANLRLAIVDLATKTITPVSGAPEYTGDGGRSFAAFKEGNQVYTAIKDASGVLNIYRTDLNTSTATKGAQVEASFVAGIARLN